MAAAPALEAHEVSHRFGARQALANVSLTVQQGRFVALLGPNGAGKTTFFSIFTRLYASRSGSVRTFGHDLGRASSLALAELGVVFQSRTLDLDLSLRQSARNDARVLRACGSGLRSGPWHDGAARRPEGRSRMTPKLTLVLAGTALLASATIGNAQPRPDPDWPCVQRKVPTISAGAVWSGPDLAAAGEWGKDFEAAALAQKLASRRTSLEEADQLIDAFARDATQDKAQRLTRVFAGVLELINTERDRVLHGIERYARGQRRLADRVRDESDRISAVKDSPGAVTTEDSRALESQFAWDRRIFEERSQALTYVCETPVLLEQRLFEIARRIQARLP